MWSRSALPCLKQVATGTLSHKTPWTHSRGDVFPRSDWVESFVTVMRNLCYVFGNRAYPYFSRLKFCTGYYRILKVSETDLMIIFLDGYFILATLIITRRMFYCQASPKRCSIWMHRWVQEWVPFVQLVPNQIHSAKTGLSFTPKMSILETNC